MTEEAIWNLGLRASLGGRGKRVEFWYAVKARLAVDIPLFIRSEKIPLGRLIPFVVAFSLADPTIPAVNLQHEICKV